jgi:hypothetical protein
MSSPFDTSARGKAHFASQVFIIEKGARLPQQAQTRRLRA